MAVLMGTTTCNDWRPDLPALARQAGQHRPQHKNRKWRRGGVKIRINSDGNRQYRKRNKMTATIALRT
jgi:hypothetical protein